MPSRKSSSRASAGNGSKHHDLAANESVAALIKLMQEEPEPVVSGHESERPAKRVKTPNPPICIAREELIVPAQTVSSGEELEFHRANIGERVKLHLQSHKEPSDSFVVATVPTWDLHLAPRGKNHKPLFRVAFRLEQATLSTRLASALHLAATQGFNSGDDGHLWAAVDADVHQTAGSAAFKFTINVMWNESLGIPLFSRSHSQHKLRAKVLSTWFAHLNLDGASKIAVQQSPQDFYEAAHVPNKEIYDSETASMHIPRLTATLYPFQKRAVQWLLKREGACWAPGEKGQGTVAPYNPPSSEIPLSFVPTKDADGNPIFLSPLFGVVAKDPSRYEPRLRGGILAEEMGLGKTLEIIALILLHQRPREEITHVFDPYLGRELRKTAATLIITPSSLLDQWISELSRHAPHLNVLYYEGIRRLAKSKQTEETLAIYDVVITTYEILRNEVHSALDPPNRSMRKSRQYERPRSPLVQLSWWRVCVDEAQMVENETSNAAILARIVPRINAWGITGTPVKDDIQKDLRGLLAFLRLEPYASDTHIWSLFTGADKTSFRELFNLVSMRHTKSLVRQEISIPPQKRYVITMPFTAVEEQHYQSLFKELAGTCGLDAQGNPLRPDWNPDDPEVQYAMRTALDRLRQTALHPEVGVRNRRALGRKAGPLRTVSEVLAAMVEQSQNAIRVDQRNILSMKLVRGQVLAGMGRVKEAQDIWEEVRSASENLVVETREEINKEIADAGRSDGAKKLDPKLWRDGDGDSSHGDDDTVPPRVGEARRRLRFALEIQHKAVFFCGNAYFSTKSNEKMTVPDSDEFKRLEKIETESYDLAKTIRKEILQESYGKTKSLMDKIEAAASTQSFTVIPELMPTDQRGIESRAIVDAFEELCGTLNDQAELLDDWREAAIQLLLKPLVDEDNNDEITGEEYEESTKLQEEIEVYVEVLRAAVADRLAALSGQKNALVEHNVAFILRMAREEEGPFPKKMLELFGVRETIKPVVTDGDPLSSIKGVISELRALSVKLRHDASNGNSRAATELTIVMNQLRLIQTQQTEQMKAATALEQEAEKFMDTLNARLDFYRQLQAVSDMVADYSGPTTEAGLSAVVAQEESASAKLATAEAKHRYLVHLQEADSSNIAEQRMCVICQSTFSIGVLTVCGHQFCKECISLWFKAHRNCPICKRHLTHANLHDITLKPQELRVHSEAQGGEAAVPDHFHISPSKKNATIYAEFNPETLAEIQNIDLEGPNYTTKVDTLVRHLLWLRESDPGAKSIVFSQYKEFLDVLTLAFRRYRIGYASFDKANGIASFRENPGTEVFLLHARAHSSGLNLVNASHVFLCEPLLNTALELQAIARVDRIGQEQETTVWLCIVDGTVEQSIYNLSVQRRMEHMGRSTKGKSKESTPELLDANLEAANTLELQQAHLSKLMGTHGISGEAVDKQDLWTCLFGNAQASSPDEPPTNLALRGLLAAEAAETRIREGAGTVGDE